MYNNIMAAGLRDRPPMLAMGRYAQWRSRKNAKDECDVLANLIENLKLDVDENKKIQKQLRKANTSLAHEFEQCKSILVETSKTLEESNSVQDSCLVALVGSDDERVALANLIANLKLDVDENKKIQKQLNKANTKLVQELKECKSILAETSRL
nr:hypothetical protein [Tanacetum cinerariifolium]